MDTKLRNEIDRLKNAKEIYQREYVTNIEELEEKVERLETQIDRSESEMKREILRKHKTLYIQEK